MQRRNEFAKTEILLLGNKGVYGLVCHEQMYRMCHQSAQSVVKVLFVFSKSSR